MRKLPLYILLAVILVTALCAASCGQSRRGRERPGLPQRPSLGVAIATNPNGSGALVQQVLPGSSAEAAGISIGDVIVEIDQTQISSPDDVRKLLLAMAPGAQCKVTVLRAGERITLPVGSNGAQQDGAPPVPPKPRLTDANVLKYALIDPSTRVVTLIGRYDAAYPTGPIAYYDLLKDALGSPYPSFSLEPTKATRNGADAVQRAVEADVNRMFADTSYCNVWVKRLLDLILNDPSLTGDRAHFLKKGAEAFQITEDEMLKVLARSANSSSASSEEMMPILAKVLRGLGVVDIADSMDLQAQGDSAASIERLGIKPEIDAIMAKYHAGELTKEQASAEVLCQLESVMLRRFGMSEADISSTMAKYRSGRMSSDELQQFVEARLTAYLTDSVGLKLFNGLTLSNALLSRLYDVPTPRMDLVFKDVPADSVLGDVLFRADYQMKSLCTSPQLKERVPGHLSEQEFMFQESVRQGTRTSGAGAEVGHRLVPGIVKMRVSPSGTVISFDEAQVRIIGWLMKEPSGKRVTGKVADLIRKGVDDYASSLTARYDDYAKACPEFHRIREASKLIALSRWAKANNYTLVVDRAYSLRLATPKTATGFWQGIFAADQQEFSLTVIAEGGASFDQKEGEDWIKPTADVEVTADVNRQLAESAVMAQQAANAALSGDMEAARDLAEKSARAMTGEIDKTQLPSLGDIPIPTEPVPAAALSGEALSAIDENLRQIENAKISMRKAADLEATSPDQAAKLREAAEAQQSAAEGHLRDLRDAMNIAMKNPAKTNEVLVTIRGANPHTSPIPSPGTNTVATPGPSTVQGGETVAPKPASPDDISPAQREKWLAELASLRKELEATKEQFTRLNASIMQDRKQFEDWEKVANDGMEKCRGFLYGLLMDASAGPLTDRYDTMYDLARKLPDKPQSLIDKLGRTKTLLNGLGHAQTFKDMVNLASSDAQTLPELLEFVRDGLTQILAVTKLDKTPAGAAWKYGSAIVDMSYSFAQFSTAYDGIGQMDKNNEGYRKAVEALTARMVVLVDQIKIVKANLAASPSPR